MPPPAAMAAAAAPPSDFSGLSAMSASVVSSRPAIDAAFCSAERVTLAGSMTPGLHEVLELAGERRSSPSCPWPSRPRCTMTAPSRPALMAIHLSGSSSALGDDRRTGRLVARQASPTTLSTAARLRTRAVPPPATMPSSIAARVADSASSMRCFFSLSSTSVAAPTLHDGNAAGELGEALLELLAVPVGVGLLDLTLDLGDPALDLVRGAATVDDRRVVLGDDDAAGPAEQVEGDVFSSLRPTSSEMTWRTGEDGDVAEHGLAAVAEAGGLHGDRRGTCPRILLTTSVASASPSTSSAMISSGLARLHDLLEHRHEVVDGGDLAVRRSGCRGPRGPPPGARGRSRSTARGSPCRTACPR